MICGGVVKLLNRRVVALRPLMLDRFDKGFELETDEGVRLIFEPYAVSENVAYLSVREGR